MNDLTYKALEALAEAGTWRIEGDNIVWLTDEHPSQADIDAWLNENTPIIVTDQLVKTYDTATESRLDEFARSGGYSSALSCVSYANSTNAKYKLDATKMIKLRDDTWQKAYDIMQEVKNDEITLPSLDEYLSMLPVLTWD